MAKLDFTTEISEAENMPSQPRGEIVSNLDFYT